MLLFPIRFMLFRSIMMLSAPTAHPKAVKRGIMVARITPDLKNVGTRERAATMVNHASTRTIQLHDRRYDDITLDEVERVLIYAVRSVSRLSEGITIIRVRTHKVVGLVVSL